MMGPSFLRHVKVKVGQICRIGVGTRTGARPNGRSNERLMVRGEAEGNRYQCADCEPSSDVVEVREDTTTFHVLLDREETSTPQKEMKIKNQKSSQVHEK
jgi:hypothetical protein